MFGRLLSLPALLAAALSSLSPAHPQGRAELAPARAAAVPRAQLDVLANGDLAAAGASYRAGFTRAGVRFAAVCGADLQEPPSLRFAPARVRSGARELPSIEDAAPLRRGSRVEFDRASFVERYEVRDGGLEQSFLFTALPSRERLEIEVGFETELAIEARADGSFAFGQERGAIEYGVAQAFDARGAHTKLVTELRGSALVLTVPAEFLATAALPLLVDPVIAPSAALATSSSPLGDADLAWDSDHESYVAVWEQRVSATNYDLVAARFAANGTPLGQPFFLDLSADAWRRPRIANLAAANAFLVVAEVSNGSQTWVEARRCRFDLLGNFTVLSALVIARSGLNGNPLGDYGAPDVGGDGDESAFGRWTVVYEHRSGSTRDIHLQQVDYLGFRVNALPTILASSSYDETEPRISRCNGGGASSSRTWAVVYQRRRFTGTSNYDSRLWCALVDPVGQLRTFFGLTTWEISDYATSTREGFDISSATDEVNGARQFLLVETRENAASGSSDIFGTRFDTTGVGLPAVELTLLENQSGVFRQRDQRWPVADTDGCRFVVAYQDAYSPVDEDIRGATFAMQGNALVLHEGGVLLAGALTRELRPALCSQVSGRGGYASYGLAMLEDDAPSYSIRRAIYAGRRNGAMSTQRATSCGALAVELGGSSALGNAIELRLPGAVGSAGFLFGVPLAPALPLCGPCALGTSAVVSLPGSTLSVQVPCEPAFVDAVIAIQGYAIGPAQSSCLGPIGLSDTLDVVVR